MPVKAWTPSEFNRQCEGRRVAQASNALPFNDTTDFDDARRGFLRKLDPCIVKNAEGRVVWDNSSYGFLAGDAP